MLRRVSQLVAIMIAGGFLVACVANWSDGASPPACPPPPTTFTKADLVGTWTASYNLHDKDILIIKDDGTFKQIYTDPDGNLSYESGWQQWWTETRDSGYIRLHLIGMHRAGELSSIFNREGGGVDPTLNTAIDYCEGKVVEMPHETILIVTGASSETPRGIELRQLRLAGTHWTWSFTLSTK
jgi:hypothetical protein